MSAANLTLDAFFATPSGSYALQWEMAQYAALVTDCFGYNALQIGVPSVDFLSPNRIGLRIIGDSNFTTLKNLPLDKRVRVELCPEELPFESESVDLIVLPHTLEVAEDPHAVLREVSRILIPNGRVVISGFNPTSLWGMRHRMQKIGFQPFLPGYQFMGVAQIRDWLKLLSFTIDRGRYGVYGSWQDKAQDKRKDWVEKAGDRWWPSCGAVYLLSAKKVVHGAKLVGRAINKDRFILGGVIAPPANKVNVTPDDVMSEQA